MAAFKPKIGQIFRSQSRLDKVIQFRIIEKIEKSDKHPCYTIRVINLSKYEIKMHVWITNIHPTRSMINAKESNKLALERAFKKYSKLCLQHTQDRLKVIEMIIDLVPAKPKGLK